MMTRQKCIAAICLTLLLQVSGSMPIFAQKSADKSVKWQSTPVPQASETNDPVEKKLRQKRNARFNDKTGMRPRLDVPQPDATRGYGSAPPYFVEIPPLPFPESHTVIVGEVVAFQPYFSEDRTSIYTELQLKVEKIIKADRPLEIGQLIPIPHLGGTLILPSGKVATYHSGPHEKTLEIHERYVLFLQFDQATSQYSVVKVWEIKEGKIAPRAVSDVRAARGGKSPYAGMPESEFLNVLIRCSQPGSGCN